MIKKQSNRFNDGRRFEELVAAVAQHYHYKKILRMEKVDPPSIWAAGRLMLVANPFPDFTGSWTERGGRSLMFEAKSTSDDKLPIAKGKLTDKQIEWLERWHYAGAVTGVLWESKLRVGFLPIGRVVQVWKSGRRHFKFDEADPVPQGQGFILFDFVQNLRKWYPT